MKPAISNWVLVLQRGGRAVDSFKLAEGRSLIGRDPENPIPLPDSSVSRQHAEVTCGSTGVTVRDLGSRNGILVNGVPRREAALQAGDKISICDFVLELTAAPRLDAKSPAREPALAAALKVDHTLEQRIHLPDARPDRDLSGLYHVCFWVTEGMEDARFAERCLGLLLETFRAQDAQLYTADRKLKAWVTESGRKPSIQLANFLGKVFQEHSEAAAIAGPDIARHQRGAGNFNYLTAPLRSPGATERSTPFVVVLRAVDQADFSVEDRVLLQAICRLWVRGQARTNQLLDLRQENVRLKARASQSAFIGSSAIMNQLREQARRAAASNATILMMGETGSGKEVLAQFIHDHSPRSSGPLVKLNCAAIPDALIESELFGYARGAFSGAERDHRGKFAQADGGTLFLDEIGEMPLAVQAKVLRALENREVQPLGSEETLTVNLRIIAATNRNLKERVRQQQFREDLYYRLDVHNLRLPPLREHLDDIDELAPHFLKKCCAENGLADMEFDPAAIEALKTHDWPGNIRELYNMVQKCALALDNRIIAQATVLAQLERSRAGT